MLRAVSIIITTYNWPEALERVLVGLTQQTYANFEVIIADDGSESKTALLIESIREQYSLNIHHVWQPDEGFRAAKIRNKAVAIASGDYLVFLDGDCIPLPSFVKRHTALAEPGWFVAGNRILLGKPYTKEVIEKKLDLSKLTFWQWLLLRSRGGCNRLLPLLFLRRYRRKNKPDKWQGAKTCNLAIWKKDFDAVRGFDEAFTGWGFEDSDLVVRLNHRGIKRKEGKFAIPVLHLWHKENNRMDADNNYRRFMFSKKRLEGKQ